MHYLYQFEHGRRIFVEPHLVREGGPGARMEATLQPIVYNNQAEAAADLYATPWRSFRRIVLPLIWPGIAAGAMLAFISSLGDVVISYFVSGPGATTLPVYVFSMVRMGVTPAVNAVSTLLMLASIAVLTISYLLGRRFQW